MGATSLFGSAAVVSTFGVLQLLAGFLSQIVLASAFGTSPELDAYLYFAAWPAAAAAFLVAPLVMVLVPFFQDQIAAGRPSRASDLFRALSGGFAAAMGVLCLAHLLVAAGQAPGQALPGQPGGLRSLLWIGALWGLNAAVNLGVLWGVFWNCHGRFARAAASAVFVPLGTIGGALLAPRHGVEGLLLCQLAGALLPLAVLWPSRFFTCGGRLHGGLGADLRSALAAGLPLWLGGGLYSFLPVIERHYAAGLGQGWISALSYAQRLPALLAALVTSGLSTALFPLLARMSAERADAEFRRHLSYACRLTLIALVFAAVLAAVMAKPLVALALRHGRFTAQDSSQVAGLLVWTIFSAVGMGLGNIVGKGLYSLKVAWPLFWSGALGMALYGVLCRLLVPSYGAHGLAAASVCYWLATAALNAWILRSRLAGRVPLAAPEGAASCEAAA